MIILPITESDIPTCAEIVSSTPLWQGYGLTFETATARLTNAMHSDDLLLVAVDDDGTAVAFLWVVARGAFNLSSYIRWFVVSSTLRGGGIGQKLIAEAEAQIKLTSRDVFLLCADFNMEAQRFYERHGYTRVGAIGDYVVPGVAEF